jgi:4'-phosphopantetheinyl transferase
MQNIVDAYLIDLDYLDHDLGRLSALLDPDEIDRARRFRFEESRRRYITRRGRLRELLSLYVDEAPERIRLTANEFGKPFLKGSDVQFNVSYSKHVGLVAVSPGKKVGCDIEWRDPGFPSADIAQAFFSPAEVRAYREVDPSQRVEAFFNCWTRKEAYIKARGWGLSLPLDSFEVSVVPGQPAKLLGGCAGWSVKGFEPIAGFEAAVVAEGECWQLRFKGFANGAGQS